MNTNISTLRILACALFMLSACPAQAQQSKAKAAVDFVIGGIGMVFAPALLFMAYSQADFAPKMEGMGHPQPASAMRQGALLSNSSALIVTILSARAIASGIHHWRDAKEKKKQAA